MKKTHTFLALLALLSVVILLFPGCGSIIVKVPQDETKDSAEHEFSATFKDSTESEIPVMTEEPKIELKLTLNAGRQSYSVEGIGNVTDKEIIIPFEYQGKPVTAVSASAFKNCRKLTSVVIPDSVTSIGNGAFYGCSNLMNITIPESITSIGDETFYGCISLTNITIPESVTSIGDRAFWGCSGLTSIVLPNSVRHLGYQVFYSCSNLQSAILGNGLTCIKFGLFENCGKLNRVQIPSSVTEIEAEAFSTCDIFQIIYYGGTESGWNNITIDGSNRATLAFTTKYYYSETQPTTEGDWWHWVDGVPTAW